jgi:hypothetical protein
MKLYLERLSREYSFFQRTALWSEAIFDPIPALPSTLCRIKTREEGQGKTRFTVPSPGIPTQ